MLTTLADQWARGFDLTEEGALVNLVWDFERLPLIPTTWLPGLLIRTLEFRGQWPDADTALRPVLPSLRSLKCAKNSLASIDSRTDNSLYDYQIFLPSCVARRIDHGMCGWDYGCLAKDIQLVGIMIATKPYYEHAV